MEKVSLLNPSLCVSNRYSTENIRGKKKINLTLPCLFTSGHQLICANVLNQFLFIQRLSISYSPLHTN